MFRSVELWGERSKLLQWALLGLIFVILTASVAVFLPNGIDWDGVIRPAALAVVLGKSPYELIPYLGFPPWALAVFAPIALLPGSLGRAVFFVISLASFTYGIIRLGAGRAVVIAFLFSPPVVHSLLNANLDWLPLLGFTLPPVYGLFFISVKPQMGSIVAIFWLVEAWKNGGLRNVIRVFAPFVVVLLFSFALYGFWPKHYFEISEVSQSWNASLWPGSIPVGLALAVAALRKREIRFAMGASPCLSPYVLLHAWSGALATLAALPFEMIAAVIGLWGIIILRLLTGGT